MRILYSHRIQSRDGQSVHLEELISAFRAEGHDVMVVGPSFYEQSDFGGESRMVALVRRFLPDAAKELAELAYNVPMYRRLRAAAADFKPDIIYERYNLYYLAGAWLARQTGLPFYVEVNSPLAEERIKFGRLRLARLAHRSERTVWRAATRVLAVTEVLKGIVVASGISPGRVGVVPNGIVLDRFPPRPPHASDGPLTIGFVGFVRDWHGMDALIDAMARHSGRKLRLVVVGDGPVRAALEAQAARLGLADSVQFTGVVPNDQVPEWVATFDVALQPKVTSYASPLKNFDYMASGAAIVAPDQPNMREILEHDRTALLFDPDRPAALWDAVERLVNDPALIARLGAAARAELEAKDYTWRGNARRIVAMASLPDTGLGNRHGRA